MRTIAKALAALIVLSSSVHAQDLPPGAPAPEEILESLYYTVALVIFCDIDVDPVLGENLARAGFELEESLGMTREDSDEAFKRVAAGFVDLPPDCDNLEAIKPLLGAE